MKFLIRFVAFILFSASTFSQSIQVPSPTPDIYTVTGRLGDLNITVSVNNTTQQINIKLNGTSANESRLLSFSEESGQLREINKNGCTFHEIAKPVNNAQNKVMGAFHYGDNSSLFWIYNLPALPLLIEVTSISKVETIQDLQTSIPCESSSKQTKSGNYYQGNKAYKVKSGAPDKEAYHPPPIEHTYYDLEGLLAACRKDKRCKAKITDWVKGNYGWHCGARDAGPDGLYLSPIDYSCYLHDRKKYNACGLKHSLQCYDIHVNFFSPIVILAYMQTLNAMRAAFVKRQSSKNKCPAEKDHFAGCR